MDMNKQKKDFWDMSWNPVKGCYGPNGKHCPYCYAKRIVKRLGYAETVAEQEMKYIYGKYWKNNSTAKSDYEILCRRIYNFKPTFFEYVYAQKLRKKPNMYFFSMSDPAYWKQEWYERIAQKIAENMQHTFVVLTKQPGIYEKYTFPHNTILGVTITDQSQMERFEYDWIDNCTLLISIEPIQSKIKLYINVDWIHVGQESGNRKNRVIATREMIEPFYDLDVPVFMKNNLAGIVPGKKLRKEMVKM